MAVNDKDNAIFLTYNTTVSVALGIETKEAFNELLISSIPNWWIGYERFRLIYFLFFCVFVCCVIGFSWWKLKRIFSIVNCQSNDTFMKDLWDDHSVWWKAPNLWLSISIYALIDTHTHPNWNIKKDIPIIKCEKMLEMMLIFYVHPFQT